MTTRRSLTVHLVDPSDLSQVTGKSANALRISRKARIGATGLAHAYNDAVGTRFIVHQDGIRLRAPAIEFADDTNGLF